MVEKNGRNNSEEIPICDGLDIFSCEKCCFSLPLVYPDHNSIVLYCPCC